MAKLPFCENRKKCIKCSFCGMLTFKNIDHCIVDYWYFLYPSALPTFRLADVLHHCLLERELQLKAGSSEAIPRFRSFTLREKSPIVNLRECLLKKSTASALSSPLLPYCKPRRKILLTLGDGRDPEAQQWDGCLCVSREEHGPCHSPHSPVIGSGKASCGHSQRDLSRQQDPKVIMAGAHLRRWTTTQAQGAHGPGWAWTSENSKGGVA